MTRPLLLATVLISVLLFLTRMPTSAQAPPPLTARQQALVTVSAYTATGDLPHLHPALSQGLDAGLTVNEAKEVLVHLYAYCGFPRSLSGINTLMQVLEERKARGIQEVVGRAASPITSTAPKYERGKKNLEQLTGKPETGPKTGANAFSPESDVFLKEHLFADLFERDVLTFQERELATVATLVSLGGVEPMLEFHLGAGLHVGLTEAQLQQLIGLCEAAVGQPKAEAARTVLTRVLKSKK
ncbi:carboxymuconolactone decarboxylase family protein [Hymenobacter sp. GOD-10R]|uniref:carboxymuconolactone decarboxylase family protein n=1 Tax=Hymenobacter sp. GOD-10R TaxID=3093922 RepID=UPI002D79157F|nr:carboxymuconolactone decarboxylase family protein [Hymenobacter sp. GOD-10R]WRQ30633.1 carboxymuconolactone decarboxylase family protein [Hymenobacter sp. GOD-10R]